MIRFLFSAQTSPAPPTLQSAANIYATDGTAAGTFLLDPGQPFATYSGEDFTDFQGSLYFLAAPSPTAPNGEPISQLYRTDGTPSGTSTVSLAGGKAADGGPGFFFGKLLVVAPGSSGVDELWGSTDGSNFTPFASGTAIFPAFVSHGLGYTGGPPGRVERGGLWRTDGTASGTYDITPAGAILVPTSFGSLANGLTAFVNVPGPDISLWVTNGTAAGTHAVTVPALGNDIDFSLGMITVSGKAVFVAVDGTGDCTVWSTDGTSNGTVPIFDAGYQAGVLPPIETIGAWGSKIVIVTASGLSIIDNAGGNRTDISPWMSDVPPASYATSADRLFLVSPPTAGGQSTTLYVSDGTAAGTMAVNVPGLASIDGPLTVVGDDVVFPRTDIFGQQALFSSNGVTAGSEEIQLPAGLTLTNSNWIAALPDVNPPGTLSLGSGSQTYVAAPGTIVQPGSGSDTITASSGNVTVLGAGGKLTFYGGTAPSLVEGGSASSTIFGGAGGGRFTGGTAGHNILVSQGASGANTTLNGGGAGDRIFGSAEGNDMLTGATGRESILGGAGNTTINGGSAADVVFAGSGNTIVYAGTAGADTIVGGAGVTNIIAQKGDAIFGSTGALLVSGSMTGADSIAGGAGSLTVAGRGGNMLVVASTGSSVINTGNGASLIFAGSGTVAVNGGAGSLQVLLGSGNSTITEGTGAARYDLVKGSGGSSDVINGFRPGTDILDLYGYQASDQQITGGGSTVVSLSDGTTITLAGVTNAGSSIIG